jgi:hypothetical protein
MRSPSSDGWSIHNRGRDGVGEQVSTPVASPSRYHAADDRRVDANDVPHRIDPQKGAARTAVRIAASIADTRPAFEELGA